LNSLYNHWWEQEDGEVEKEIKEVSDGINDSKYTSSDYKRILSVFCTLKEKGFDIDVGSTLDTMKGRIKSGDRILSSQFENFDPEEKGQAYQKYREAVMELEHSLGNAESDATTNYLEKLISEKNWGLGFSSYFRMKQNDLQPDTGFLSRIDLAHCWDALGEASVKDFSDFRRSFVSIYGSATGSLFFKKDIDWIKKLLGYLNGAVYDSLTKEINRKQFIAQIEELIKQSEQADNQR